MDLSSLPSNQKVATAAAALHEEILLGVFGADGLLPTEPELMERFGVARETVRRALQLLKERGLVVSRQGSGTFVRARPQRAVLRQELRVHRDNTGYSFNEAADSWAALRTSVPRRGVAPADIAEVLGVGRGDEVIVRARLMGDPQTREPQQLTTTYIPLHVVERLPDQQAEGTDPDAILDRLEDAGPALSWSVEIGARMPEPSEAAALNSPAGIPLVQVILISRQAGVVVEVTEYVVSSERFRIGYELEHDASARRISESD